MKNKKRKIRKTDFNRSFITKNWHKKKMPIYYSIFEKNPKMDIIAWFWGWKTQNNAFYQKNAILGRKFPLTKKRTMFFSAIYWCAFGEKKNLYNDFLTQCSHDFKKFICFLEKKSDILVFEPENRQKSNFNRVFEVIFSKNTSNFSP